VFSIHTAGTNLFKVLNASSYIQSNLGLALGLAGNGNAAASERIPDLPRGERGKEDGKSPGEGPKRNQDGTYNKSQVGQREQPQKKAGNLKERPAEARSALAATRQGTGAAFPLQEHEEGRGRERSRR
jgi:hypothetical protein